MRSAKEKWKSNSPVFPTFLFTIQTIMSMLATPTLERRRHPRTPLRMRLSGIRLDPDGGDVVDTFHMQDISRSGMGALSGRSFYPGQRLVLCLPLSSANGRRNIYATIVRCREREGEYHVGLEFDAGSVDSYYGAAPSVAAA